jgi:membrane protein implicated in regulation of membrane protease activity
MEISTEFLWLIVGVILITLEFTALPGVGLLFAGVSALLVGILVESTGTNQSYQWVIFLAATIIMTLLFYKPLRNYQTNKDAKYSDIIGQSAIVTGTLVPGVEGKVRWSGTTMKARLQSANTLIEGKSVKITAVDGNVLIVQEE